MSLSTSEIASSTVATTGSTSLTPGTAPSGASGSTTAAVGSLGAPSTASTVNATLLSAVRSAVQEEVQAALNRAGIPLVAGGAPAEPASSSPSGKRLTSITCDGKDRSPRTHRGQALRHRAGQLENAPPPPPIVAGATRGRGRMWTWAAIGSTRQVSPDQHLLQAAVGAGARWNKFHRAGQLISAIAVRVELAPVAGSAGR